MYVLYTYVYTSDEVGGEKLRMAKSAGFRAHGFGKSENEKVIRGAIRKLSNHVMQKNS